MQYDATVERPNGVKWEYTQDSWEANHYRHWGGLSVLIESNHLLENVLFRQENVQ